MEPLIDAKERECEAAVENEGAEGGSESDKVVEEGCEALVGGSGTSATSGIAAGALKAFGVQDVRAPVGWGLFCFFPITRFFRLTNMFFILVGLSRESEKP